MSAAIKRQFTEVKNFASLKSMMIRSSYDAWLILKDHISYEQEEVWCLALNSISQVLGKRMIFRGTVDSCPLHARDLFRYLISVNSNQFIIAHSHPSQNPSPSSQDFELTNRVSLLAFLMEIHLIDHLILAPQSYFSFSESSLLKQVNDFEESLGGLVR